MASNIPEKREHAGSRSGGLVERKHKMRPDYAPYGRIAYAVAYQRMEEMGAQQAERALIRDLQGRVRWQVQYYHAGHCEWLTAARGMQGRTLEEAISKVRAMSRVGGGYRVMLMDSRGEFSQRVKVTPGH